MENNFLLTDGKGRSIDRSSWERLVVPKAEISMAVILDDMAIGDRCPRCNTKIRLLGHMPGEFVKW